MSRYIKKNPGRPYVKTTAGKRTVVEAWYERRLALGTQQQLAHDVGLSIERVSRIVADYRRRHGIKIT